MTSSKASMPVAVIYRHLTLLLLFTSFLQHASKLVFADDKLIQLQCHNAEVPATCVRCVESDPRGKLVDDAVGIAAIILNCLSNNAETLANNMSVLSSRVQDKNVKSIFQNCERGFIDAKRDLSNATNELKSKDYDKTNHFVRTAITPELTCRDNILKLRVPSSVLFVMRVYEELSDAAMRIIDRF